MTRRGALLIGAVSVLVVAGAGALAYLFRPAPEPEPEEPLSLVDPRIVIDKGARRLRVYSNGEVVRTYPIGLGGNPSVDKEREGDRATPEGSFYICAKNPKSKYFLSMCISYPNAEDAERGLRDGLIDAATRNEIVASIRAGRMPPQKTPLGGEIYIHGNGASADWTLGCIALENDAMQALFDAIPHGTPVVINP